MKKMIKRVREEKGGFTLAELLIVVAILLVLIAIAVPMFTGAMDKANNAVQLANARSAQSEAMANYQLAEKSEQAGLTEQTFYYDDHGNEVSSEGEATYQYTVHITTGTDKTVSATVDMVKPEAKDNILKTDAGNPAA